MASPMLAAKVLCRDEDFFALSKMHRITQALVVSKLPSVYPRKICLAAAVTLISGTARISYEKSQQLLLLHLLLGLFIAVTAHSLLDFSFYFKGDTLLLLIGVLMSQTYFIIRSEQRCSLLRQESPLCQDLGLMRLARETITLLKGPGIIMMPQDLDSRELLSDCDYKRVLKQRLALSW